MIHFKILQSPLPGYLMVTPLILSYKQAQAGSYSRLELPQSAVDTLIEHQHTTDTRSVKCKLQYGLPKTCERENCTTAQKWKTCGRHFACPVKGRHLYQQTRIVQFFKGKCHFTVNTTKCINRCSKLISSMRL